MDLLRRGVCIECTNYRIFVHQDIRVFHNQLTDMGFILKPQSFCNLSRHGFVCFIYETRENRGAALQKQL